MGVVQVQLPDELKSIIDRHVAEGRAASEAAYVTEALRLYAELLDSDDEIAEIIERAPSTCCRWNSGRRGVLIGGRRQA
jgi:Arc/MetJ-type ribon-helix-helix transcriptional regulator